MRGQRWWLVMLALTGLVACQNSPLRPVATEAPASARVLAMGAAEPVANPETPAGDPASAAAYFLLPPDPEPLDSTGAVLARLRARLVSPSCRSHPRIEYWQDRYAASPQRFAEQIVSTLPLMALVLDELERWHLPGEYALVPIAESWYRLDARGTGDHLGAWQIGRSTASTLDLPVRADFDGRLDALASTDAALRYLALLHNRFGDWRLATAAYNVGPNKVQRLINRQGQVEFSHARRQPDGLPGTTFEHLARIEALVCLLGEPDRFGLPFTPSQPLDPLVAIQLNPGQSSLQAIAEERGIPVPVLARLNPAFRSGFIARDAPRTLLVPKSLSTGLQDFELPFVTAPAPEPIPAGKVHVIQPGDTLGAIARRHRVRLQVLFALNGLDARSILRPGQRIRLAP